MGYFFTLIFLIITHLSVEHVAPALAPFRPMVWLSILGILVSMIALPMAGNILRSPSVLVFLAFYFFLPTSRLLHGWLGGAYPALMDFLPIVVVFFLILINVTTPKRAKILLSCLLLCGFYMGFRGMQELPGEGMSDFVFEQRIVIDFTTWEIMVVRRIRALGFLADPNDFAQFLLMLAPVLLLFWKKRSYFRNLFFVWMPLGYLLYLVLHTRSRGGALGLFVLVLFFIRDHANRITSIIVTTGAIVLGMGLQFGAGRAISIGGGSDRLDIWSDGLGMFKSSPLWGIGYKGFTEFSKLTAHNSYLLAASELGLIGLFLWMALIVFSVVHLSRLNNAYKAGLLDPEWAPVVRVIRYSFYSFLTTSYFLSRTYSLDIYILIAMSIILAERAMPERQPQSAPAPAPMPAATAPAASTTPATATTPAAPPAAAAPAPEPIRYVPSRPFDPARPRPTPAAVEAAPEQNQPAPESSSPAWVPLSFNQWFTYSAIASVGIVISIYTAVRMRSF